MLLILVILAVGIRLYELGAQSLWSDEVRSVQQASEIREQGIRSLLFDKRGGLYFYLLALTTPQVAAEARLRLPSVIFGSILVLVAYWLGKAAAGRRVGLLAAAFCAISPFAVWYSQEVRYVGLFILLAGVSLLLSYRMVVRERRSDAVLYCVASILMLFSFIGSGLTVLAENAWVCLARPRRSIVYRWVLCQAILASVLVPWLGAAYGLGHGPFSNRKGAAFQAEALRTGVPRPNRMIDIGYAVFVMSAGHSLGPSRSELHEDPSMRPLVRRIWSVAAVIAVFGCLGIAGVRELYRRSQRALGLILSALVFPLIGMHALALCSGGVYNVRYVAGAFLPYSIVVAAGVFGFSKRRYLGAIVVGGLVALLGFSLYNHFCNPAYHKEDSAAAARLVRDLRGPGEPLIVGAEWRAFGYYYQEDFEPWFRIQLGRGKAHTLHSRELSGANRIWVVATREWENSTFSELMGKLESCFAVEQSHSVTGYRILSFVSRAGHENEECVLQP